jgi:hypothetical protein
MYSLQSEPRRQQVISDLVDPNRERCAERRDDLHN